MKTTILCMSVISAIFTFSSCKKDDQATQIATLTASKTTAIATGESVTFKTSKKAATDSVNWSVTPASGATIIASDTLAFISFKQLGQYTVTAKSNGLSSSKIVTVSIQIPASAGSKDSTAVLNGDQIKLTPKFDSAGNISLYAVTTKSYLYLNNYLISDLNFSNNTSTINYTGVFIPAQLNAINGQQAAFTKNIVTASVDGTYNLLINLNGITYKGSYVKSGNTVKFTWTYTSGVTFSLLTITK